MRRADLRNPLFAEYNCTYKVRVEVAIVLNIQTFKFKRSLSRSHRGEKGYGTKEKYKLHVHTSSLSFPWLPWLFCVSFSRKVCES
jgi:hypothetical protein